MIESIVAIIFGIVITVVSACSNAGVEIIVLGALLTLTGIGCLVANYVTKNSIKSGNDAEKLTSNITNEEIEDSLAKDSSVSAQPVAKQTKKDNVSVKTVKNSKKSSKK